MQRMLRICLVKGYKRTQSFDLKVGGWYRFNQNIPSGPLHTYALNEFLTADGSCTTKYFWKKSYRSLQSASLRFFWLILRQNWLIIGGTVSLWSMFENRQLTVFEGKCCRFRNSSECLKTHCGANNWPIWTQKVPKEA